MSDSPKPKPKEALANAKGVRRQHASELNGKDANFINESLENFSDSQPQVMNTLAPPDAPPPSPPKKPKP